MNNNINSSKKSTIRFIYICVYIFLSGVFLKLFYAQIVKSFLEHDFLEMIPATVIETEGLSFIRLVSYLLSPFPFWFAIPPLKMYTFFLLSLFGPLAKYFIFVSILFHFCCSLLLFIVSKKLGLGSRTSFLSSLMYLTLFAHFHTYMWPVAFQHLIVVFFILLGLLFYLKTDRLISSGDNYRLSFILTLLINSVASFCRLSIFILPAMIFTHILFCSKDDKDRIKKYDIWLPLFMIYLIYPLVVLVTGDPRVKGLCQPLFPLVTDNKMFQMFIYKINNLTIFSILFLVGLSFLFSVRAMLVMYQRYNLRKILRWTSITMSIVAMVILIILGGLKRLLILYNIMVPFVGILASFLYPLQNALLIDSARGYYFIPLQLSVFNFLLTFLILGLFIKNFGLQHRQLIVLVVWYMVDMIYLYLWNPLTSRYFIYLSPLFCIIFSAVFDYLYTHLTNLTKLKAITKEFILVLIFVSLCIPNLLAIRLALFRGKMVNTFPTYDYIRAAEAVKEDLIKNNSIKDIKRKAIYVNNVIPLTFGQIKNYPAPTPDPHSGNLCFVFMQVFNDVSIDVRPNQIPQKNEDYIIYSLNGYRINDKYGVNISPFSQLLEAATEKLRLARYPEAMALFSKAIKEKPYLLNYVLSNLKLEDLEWVTSVSDMRSWISRIGCFSAFDTYGLALKRTYYISSILHKEIDEYIQCLFYASFLKYIAGDIEESKYWFSQIRFLENDYSRLYSWLSQVPLIKSDKKMLSFLDNFNNNSLYVRPENYTDRYKFEKFLFRLAFGTL